MSHSSDVLTKRVTGTGSLAVGPARIRQIQVLTDSGGAGRLTITDANGGSTVLDLDFKASDSHSVNIPNDGIRCASDVYISAATNITAITVFYNQGAYMRVYYKKGGGVKSPAWQRKEGKSKSGGLNAKGVASYRKANPGSKLKTAVTTKPSKLKKGSKAAKRRKSFCARMKGMKKSRTGAKTANDPNSRINKSLRKWNC